MSPLDPGHRVTHADDAKDQVEERAELLVTGQNFAGRNTTIPYKEVVPRP